MTETPEKEAGNSQEIDWQGLLKRFANDPEASIDPRVVADAAESLSEEQIVGMYSPEGGQEERLPLVEKWFPGENEWQGKTVINEHQAVALSLVPHLPQAFHEIGELEGLLTDIVDDYKMLLTSVDGVAREQQMRVLMSMFGKQIDDESDARTALMTALAGKESDDD